VLRAGSPTWIPVTVSPYAAGQVEQPHQTCQPMMMLLLVKVVEQSTQKTGTE
jgi:hypothetical protein